MTLEGVLPVFKPTGMTSHDVVAKVRKMVGMKRIGHTGTLDPQVTGVLPLCLGRATRIVEYIQDLPKQYEAEFIIGLATDTEDLTGNVTEKADQVVLTGQQIRETVQSFLGEIEQIPPMYSAVRIGGKRLYELARQGVDIERKPRKVQIYEIDILAVDLNELYPKVKISVRCSKGTYIRTLCTDIGKALGYPAVMSKLTRTSTGNITLGQCLTLEEIEQWAKQGQLARKLIPVDQAIAHLKACYVSGHLVKQALAGQMIPVSQISLQGAVPEETIRLYSSGHRFLGIFKLDKQGGMAIPVKVFN